MFSVRWLFKRNSGKTSYTISKKVYLRQPIVAPRGEYGVVAFCADAAGGPEVAAAANGSAAQGHVTGDIRLMELAVPNA